MTDLSSLKVSKEAIKMEIYHPKDGTKMDITLDVLGYDSDEYKMEARRLLENAMKKAPKKDLTRLSYEDDAEYAVLLDSLHLKGWKNIVENEKQVKFSKENAVRILKEYPWIRTQMKEFVQERANFINA